MGGTTAKASVIEGGEINAHGRVRDRRQPCRRAAGSTGAAASCSACPPSTSRRSARAAAASSRVDDGGRAPRRAAQRGRGARGRCATTRAAREATLTDANVVARLSASGAAAERPAPRRGQGRGAAIASRWPRRSASSLDEAAYGVYLLGVRGHGARGARGDDRARARSAGLRRSSPSAATARSSRPRWRARSRSGRSSCRPRRASSAPWACSRPRWSITSCARSCARCSRRRPPRSPPPWPPSRARPPHSSRTRATARAASSSARWTASTRGSRSSSACRCPRGSTPALATELAETFGREHERTYGHKAEGDPIQIVNLRLTARARAPARAGSAQVGRWRAPAPRGERAAYFGPRARNAGDAGDRATPISARRRAPGPLLVDEYDATTLVPPGCTARLDEHDNIVIRVD